MEHTPYRWLHRLGSGTSGEVWAAVRNGREVAVKVLRSRRGTAHHEALKREMRLGPLLAGHPGIVAVREVVDVGGVLHLEMDWVRGPSLADVLDARSLEDAGPLPSRVVVPWAIQVLEALAWAGQQVAPRNPTSFVHRDIKPANLLLEPRGRVRITDFGIARAEAELGFQTTQSGIVKGSPRFMASELLLDRGVDARADQFALGAVLFELLTGEALYQAPDLASVLLLALQADVEERLRLVDEAPALVEVLRRLLGREPQQRFPSHRAAIEALGRVPVKGPSLEVLLDDLLACAAGPLGSPDGPSLSRLPALDQIFAAATLTADDLTDDVVGVLAAAREEEDVSVTGPITRPIGFEAEPSTQPLGLAAGPATQPLVPMRFLDEEDDDDERFPFEPEGRDGDTMPIPLRGRNPDDEDTVLKSVDEVLAELGQLEEENPEKTVASEELSLSLDETSVTGRPHGDDTTAAMRHATPAPGPISAPPPPRPAAPAPPPEGGGSVGVVLALFGGLVLILGFLVVALATGVLLWFWLG